MREDQFVSSHRVGTLVEGDIDDPIEIVLVAFLLVLFIFAPVFRGLPGGNGRPDVIGFLDSPEIGPRQGDPVF